MSKVDNTDPIERKVHIEFHCLAVKHDVNVDTVAEIIKDWMNWEERHFIISREECNPNKRERFDKEGNYIGGQ